MKKRIRLALVATFTGVAGAVSHTPSAARAAHIPFAPCSLTGAVNPCRGLLAPDFMPNPQAGQLRKVFESEVDGWAHTGQNTRRLVKGSCSAAEAPCQYAQTYYNPESREVKLWELGDRPLVIGAIRWKPSVARRDTMYDVGENLPDVPLLRLSVFVAFHKRPPFKYDSSGIQAHWRLYVFKMRDRQLQLDSANEGAIRLCERAHPDTAKVHAGMRACPGPGGLLEATALAQRFGVSRSAILEAANCELGALKWGGGSLSEQCSAQRRGRLSALFSPSRAAAADEAVMAFLRASDNEEQGPYWFSCSAGCCTADPF